MSYAFRPEVPWFSNPTYNDIALAVNGEASFVSYLVGEEGLNFPLLRLASLPHHLISNFLLVFFIQIFVLSGFWLDLRLFNCLHPRYYLP